MQAYRNRAGDSAVSAFDIGRDFIDVQFKDGALYRYDYTSTGSSNVETMKHLAHCGRGLNSFILRTMRNHIPQS